MRDVFDGGEIMIGYQQLLRTAETRRNVLSVATSLPECFDLFDGESGDVKDDFIGLLPIAMRSAK